MKYLVAINGRLVTAHGSVPLYRFLKSLMNVELATKITEWANNAKDGDVYDGGKFTVTVKEV